MTLPNGWKKESSSAEYDKKTSSWDEPPSHDGYITDVNIWKDEVTDFWGRKVIDAVYITTTKGVRNVVVGMDYNDAFKYKVDSNAPPDGAPLERLAEGEAASHM